MSKEETIEPMQMESHARHYGIDLLKITAMLMVSLMHPLIGGGIMGGVGPFSVKYEALSLLEAFAYCAVDCFALASGFILAHMAFRFQQLLSLWIQVASHCVVIPAIFSISRPETVALRAWLFALFPVTFGQYWDFPACFGMFCMIPLLNHILHTMQQKPLLCTIGIFVLLDVSISSIGHAPVFESEHGYFLLCAGIDFLCLSLFHALQVPERCEALVCCVKRRLPSLSVRSCESSDLSDDILSVCVSRSVRVGAMRPAHV